MNSHTFRPLLANEVEFKVKVEEETDFSVHGAFASGDDAWDKETENEILSRLRRGDSYAWCCIVIEAKWNGWVGFDSLGGCCLEGESEVESTITDHGMRENALANLNANIQAELDNLSPRIE